MKGSDFYRSILENISDGIYVCDPDRRIDARIAATAAIIADGATGLNPTAKQAATEVVTINAAAASRMAPGTHAPAHGATRPDLARFRPAEDRAW